MRFVPVSVILALSFRSPYAAQRSRDAGGGESEARKEPKDETMNGVERTRPGSRRNGGRERPRRERDRRRE